MFRSCSIKPLALTDFSPPFFSRIVFAISLATCRSSVARLTLYAMRYGRAPMTVAPAVRQVAVFRPRGGSFVKIDRDLQLAPHALAHAPRHRHAVVHRDGAHRDERNDVGRADAWVLPAVHAEIDQTRGGLDAAERAFLDRDGSA